ncbi:MAG: tyrosine-protein phosphatase, partial [Pseudoclavibacter sp.]
VAPVEETPLNNLRDLGGVAVADGVLRTGVAFRSDDVSTVPAAQAAELYELGVRSLIDLRSDAEASHTGRGPLGAYDVAYHRLPLARGGAEPGEFLRHLQERSATAEIVGGYYARTLVAEAGTIARGIALIAHSDDGVLFHCAAGKDRTGIFAAAFLSALGAGDEAIATDYALSAPAIPRIMARVSASIGHLMGESNAYLRAIAEGDAHEASPLLGAEPDAMRAMLETIRREHGGALRVLQRAGLGDATIERLRERAVRAA